MFRCSYFHSIYKDHKPAVGNYPIKPKILRHHFIHFCMIAVLLMLLGYVKVKRICLRTNLLCSHVLELFSHILSQVWCCDFCLLVQKKGISNVYNVQCGFNRFNNILCLRKLVIKKLFIHKSKCGVSTILGECCPKRHFIHNTLYARGTPNRARASQRELFNKRLNNLPIAQQTSHGGDGGLQFGLPSDASNVSFYFGFVVFMLSMRQMA